MISKTVTYNNLLTGRPVTEELWFHLRKDEIIRIMGRAKKDWDDYIKEMMSREDVDEIFDFVESILKMAYGERSEDGRTFRKDKKLQEDFANSEAYSELFIDMITDAVSADGKETSKFFSALVGDSNKGTVPESVSKLKK